MSDDIILIPAMDWREVRISDPESSYQCGNGEHSFMPPIADGSEHIILCECGKTESTAAFIDGHWRMRFSDVF